MTSSDEATAGNKHLKVRYGQVNREYAMHLATRPVEDDGPVWMVNLMKHRDVADYGDHRETAIADTYTIILRPTINRLRDSIES